MILYTILGEVILCHLHLVVEEENENLKLMMEDNQDAKNCLIEHNLRLVVYIARKFDNTGINVEDLISIGTIGLIKSY